MRTAWGPNVFIDPLNASSARRNHVVCSYYVTAVCKITATIFVHQYLL
jgi:hypothetical protein